MKTAQVVWLFSFRDKSTIDLENPKRGTVRKFLRDVSDDYYMMAYCYRKSWIDTAYCMLKPKQLKKIGKNYYVNKESVQWL